jgi:hypothetical protein
VKANIQQLKWEREALKDGGKAQREREAAAEAEAVVGHIHTVLTPLRQFLSSLLI